MIQLSSLADIVALGGFNPNKYLTPAPMPFSAPQPFSSQFAHTSQGFVPPHILHHQMNSQQQNGMPQPHHTQSFVPTGHNNKGKGSFKNSPNKHRYEKKDKPKSGKKDKASGEKKYVTKQKEIKEVIEVKTEEELPK